MPLLRRERTWKVDGERGEWVGGLLAGGLSEMAFEKDFVQGPSLGRKVTGRGGEGRLLPVRERRMKEP